MAVFVSRLLVWTSCTLLLAGLAACANVGQALTPYKTEVVQGNFISREQVQLLQPGMGRNQVRDLLGTPLMASLFHADRWDYVFTVKREGVEPQSRRLSVFFKDDVLTRFEGDDMPSEAEFVARIDTRRKVDKVPSLQASEQELKAYEPKARSAAATKPAAALPTQYPPLESR